MANNGNDKAIRLGKKIRHVMNSFGFTVKQLSIKTDIELQTLYSILNGHHLPSIDKLEGISKVLHLSIDALLDIEVNTFPIFSTPHQAGMSYAEFEDIWFGEHGGERISVSRNFSIMNQSVELRKDILKNIYMFNNKQIDKSIEAFEHRKGIIAAKEKQRLEIVVNTEVEDFIRRRESFNLISKNLIGDMIEGIVDKLKEHPMDFEVVIIDRHNFLVNYEMINREVILFDLGSVFFRQTHPKIIEHFMKEVETLKFKNAKINQREKVIKYLMGLLNEI
ncbi:MAG: helix-turn-helix domain-containing protein [Melioribacteraceae bacterium]|nr:helix-turn-helix domain-containing protein [Melioribacteraceae bacterium]